jgi:hypothetical protein
MMEHNVDVMVVKLLCPHLSQMQSHDESIQILKAMIQVELLYSNHLFHPFQVSP